MSVVPSISTRRRLVTRAPLRISFGGGGSDLPSFYRRSGGQVLSVTIDRFVSVATEVVGEGDTRPSAHPTVRAVSARLGLSGLEVHSHGDAPPGTGLGSSSAFAVALLHNFHLRRGHVPAPEALAREACEVELGDLGSPMGKQDAYASAYGGLNVISFEPDDAVRVSPVDLPRQMLRRLEESLLLFFTGRRRSSATVLAEQATNMKHEGPYRTVADLAALVLPMRRALEDGELEAFGHLLDESWTRKRTLARGITDASIDNIYRLARKQGAIGGKLLGAGGGGYFLLCCDSDSHPRIRQALSPLREIPVRFHMRGAESVEEPAEAPARTTPSRESCSQQ